MYIKNIRVFVCISFFPFEPTIVFSYGTSFFLLYNIFKLAHPFVRQFPTAWWYLSDIAGNARSVSIREARPTVGVRRCRFDWKWFLENKSKKNCSALFRNFDSCILDCPLFSEPPPPLKTFTKHLHNEYLIKINTLLLR